jgi:hypothetical protein
MLDHYDDNRAKSGLNTDKHSNRAGFLNLNSPLLAAWDESEI